MPGSVGRPGGEAGLLGLALHPDDAKQLFAFVSTSEDERIVRIAFEDDRLGDIEPILTGLPTGGRHHGGRMLFGPDGHPVRRHRRGRPDRNSPRTAIRSAARSCGSRRTASPRTATRSTTRSGRGGTATSRGLAFDDDDRLWACEFGDDEVDELNLIERGGNYGWPEFEGRSDDPDYITPKVTWPVGDCSPSGMAITQSTAFVAALRGERLWSVPLDGTDVGEPAGSLRRRVRATAHGRRGPR